MVEADAPFVATLITTNFQNFVYWVETVYGIDGKSSIWFHFSEFEIQGDIIEE